MEGCDLLVVRFDGDEDGVGEGEGSGVGGEKEIEERKAGERKVKKKKKKKANGCPVSLIELALFIGRMDGINIEKKDQGGGRRKKEVIVYCPEGYWIRGNVEMVCRRYEKLGVRFVGEEEDLGHVVAVKIREMMGF